MSSDGYRSIPCQKCFKTIGHVYISSVSEAQTLINWLKRGSFRCDKCKLKESKKQKVGSVE